jgi:hypothetical protein
MKPASDKPQPGRLPRGAARLMIAVIVAMTLLAIYANVQRTRRATIEKVSVTASSPAPSTNPPTP